MRPSNADRTQPGRGRPVLRHGAHGRRGRVDRVPDYAIFADAHWEPPSVYEHIEWLAGQLPFPLHVVDNERSLRKDVKARTYHPFHPHFPDEPRGRVVIGKKATHLSRIREHHSW